MPLIDVLVLEGASASSVAITFDLLATANTLHKQAGRMPLFQVRVSGSGAGWATQLARWSGKAPARRAADVVIVPGLAWSDERLVRAGLQRPDADAARKALRAAAKAGAEIVSSCSAVFLVASAGLLDGRRATTTWWLAPLFRSLFPAVTLEPEAMTVTDRGLTTAGAAMAQMDVMLSVIARHGGPDLADRCARLLLLAQRPSQSAYMAVSFLAASDERVSRAERWARARLHRTFSVAELARAAGLGSRTFARRCARITGLTPAQFVRKLRVERATELLQTTRLSVEAIAERVGYADPSTLRKLLHRERRMGARATRAESARRSEPSPRRAARPSGGAARVRERSGSPTRRGRGPSAG
jgi:transcriptional regulator GlxA family with amidase domain